MSDITTAAQDINRDLELHFEGATDVVPLRHALSKGTRKASYWGVLYRDPSTGDRYFRQVGVRLTTALAESLPSYVDIKDPVSGNKIRVDLVPDEKAAEDGVQAVRAQQQVLLPGVGADRMFKCKVSITKSGGWNLTIVASNLTTQAFEVADL